MNDNLHKSAYIACYFDKTAFELIIFTSYQLSGLVWKVKVQSADYTL